MVRQDLPAGVIAAHPRLYQQTVLCRRAAFWRAAARWAAEALWHSAVVMLVSVPPSRCHVAQVQAAR